MSSQIKLYDGDADDLMSGDHAEQVSLLPGDPSPGFSAGERIRVPWGQDMLRDMLDGRYRAVVCGVNDEDNSHGIIAQLVHLVTSSQWTQQTVTNYAKVFQESVSVHAAHDHEPYVLKYDLDSILILALLRPKGQDHFTTADLARGFSTVSNGSCRMPATHPSAYSAMSMPASCNPAQRSSRPWPVIRRLSRGSSTRSSAASGIPKRCRCSATPDDPLRSLFHIAVRSRISLP